MKPLDIFSRISQDSGKFQKTALWKGRQNGCKIDLVRPPVLETFHGNQQRAGLFLFQAEIDRGLNRYTNNQRPLPKNVSWDGVGERQTEKSSMEVREVLDTRKWEKAERHAPMTDPSRLLPRQPVPFNQGFPHIVRRKSRPQEVGNKFSTGQTGCQKPQICRREKPTTVERGS